MLKFVSLYLAEVTPWPSRFSDLGPRILSVAALKKMILLQTFMDIFSNMYYVSELYFRLCLIYVTMYFSLEGFARLGAEVFILS